MVHEMRDYSKTRIQSFKDRYKIRIVYKNGFIRRLLGKGELEEIYIGSSTVWYKCTTIGTGRAGTSKEIELTSILNYHFQNDIPLGRWNNYI